MKKRIVSLLLVLAMVLSIIPVTPAVAADDGYLTYEIVDGEATITECDTSVSGSLTIPDTLEGYPVTAIESLAFFNCAALTEIVIPDSVQSIGLGAFYGCISLESITVPFVGSDGNGSNTFGYIFGKSSYSGSTATDQNGNTYYIPNSLKSVTVTGGEISENAFYNCVLLTNISILDGATQIGTSAFYGCSNLTQINLPDGLDIIGAYAFGCCSRLKEVNLPDSVKVIGYGAFRDCYSLRGVNIPEGVTSINGSTFEYCSSLISITIPDSVTSIGSYAFAECHDLVGITIPQGVTTIEINTFDGCYNLETVSILGPVTEIGESAFASCDGMTSIVLPKELSTISEGVFDRCYNLENVYYGGTEKQWAMMSIGSENDELTAATIHYASAAPVVTPDESAEDPWYLTYKIYGDIAMITDCDESVSGELVIPSFLGGYSVAAIAEEAFSNCTGLTGLVIPDSVKIIGKGALKGCSNLESLTIPFAGRSRNYGIYERYPMGIIFGRESYPGGEATEQCYMDDVDTEGTFYIPASLTAVTLTGKKIFFGALSGCANLTSITLSDSITDIYSSAFYNCWSLTDVYYGGTQEQWEQIGIGEDNEYLTDATIHFESAGPETDSDKPAVWLDLIAESTITPHVGYYVDGDMDNLTDEEPAEAEYLTDAHVGTGSWMHGADWPIPDGAIPAAVLDLGETKTIGGLDLVGKPQYGLTSYEIEVLTESGWTDIQNPVTETRGTGAFVTFDPVACSQVRILISAWTNQHPMLQEVSIYEVKTTTPLVQVPVAGVVANQNPTIAADSVENLIDGDRYSIYQIGAGNLPVQITFDTTNGDGSANNISRMTIFAYRADRYNIAEFTVEVQGEPNGDWTQVHTGTAYAQNHTDTFVLDLAQSYAAYAVRLTVNSSTAQGLCLPEVRLFGSGETYAPPATEAPSQPETQPSDPTQGTEPSEPAGEPTEPVEPTVPTGTAVPEAPVVSVGTTTIENGVAIEGDVYKFVPKSMLSAQFGYYNASGTFVDKMDGSCAIDGWYGRAGYSECTTSQGQMALILTLDEAKLIGAMDICPRGGYPNNAPESFEIQVMIGGNWVTAVTVTENAFTDGNTVRFTFPAVETNQVRMLIHKVVGGTSTQCYLDEIELCEVTTGKLYNDIDLVGQVTESNSFGNNPASNLTDGDRTSNTIGSCYTINLTGTNGEPTSIDGYRLYFHRGDQAYASNVNVMIQKTPNGEFESIGLFATGWNTSDPRDYAFIDFGQTYQAYSIMLNMDAYGYFNEFELFQFQKEENTNPPTEPAAPIPTETRPPVAETGADLWIDPIYGNDANDGTTQYTALKTIQAAKSKAAKLSETKNVVVVLLSGTYDATETIVFGEEDSGRNGHTITYRAASGETPIISGGARLDGWTLYDAEKNIYVADIPAGAELSRDFYVNGEPQTMAKMELSPIDWEVLNSSGYKSPAVDSDDSHEYLILDLGENKLVSGLTLYAGSERAADGNAAGFPKDFTIQTSGDGIHWTTQVIEVNCEAPIARGGKQFIFNTVATRYIKIDVTKLGNAARNANKHFLALSEIFVGVSGAESKVNLNLVQHLNMDTPVATKTVSLTAGVAKEIEIGTNAIAVSGIKLSANSGLAGVRNELTIEAFNGKQWVTVYTKKNQLFTAENVIAFNATKATKIRLTTNFDLSGAKILVYAPTNLANGATVTAPGQNVRKLTDGTLDGYYTGANYVTSLAGDEDIVINLGSVQDVGAVRLYPTYENGKTTGYMKAVRVLTSKDGETYTTALELDNVQIPEFGSQLLVFAYGVKAQYIKIQPLLLTSAGNDYRLQLEEVEVVPTKVAVDESNQGPTTGYKPVYTPVALASATPYLGYYADVNDLSGLPVDYQFAAGEDACIIDKKANSHGYTGIFNYGELAAHGGTKVPTFYVDMGVPTKMNTIDIVLDKDIWGAPRTYKVQVNDGTQWITVAEQENAVWSSQNYAIHAEFDTVNATAARILAYNLYLKDGTYPAAIDQNPGLYTTNFILNEFNPQLKEMVAYEVDTNTEAPTVQYNKVSLSSDNVIGLGYYRDTDRVLVNPYYTGYNSDFNGTYLKSAVKGMFDGNNTTYGGTGALQYQWMPPIGINTPVILLDVSKTNGGNPVNINAVELTVREDGRNAPYDYIIQVTTSATEDNWITITEETAKDWTISNKELYKFPAMEIYKMRLVSTFTTPDANIPIENCYGSIYSSMQLVELALYNISDPTNPVADNLCTQGDKTSGDRTYKVHTIEALNDNTENRYNANKAIDGYIDPVEEIGFAVPEKYNFDELWHPENVEMNTLYLWYHNMQHFTGASGDGTEIYLETSLMPTWIANDYLFIDSVGEWYIDRDEGKIYYKADGTMDDKEAFLAVTERIIEMEYASNIQFEGITFSHTTWTHNSEYEYNDQQSNAYYEDGKWKQVPAGIQLTGCENVVFDNCEIANMGTAGIKIKSDGNRLSDGNQIVNSRIYDIGYSGIIVGEIYGHHGYMSWMLVKNTTIRNNYITRVGLEIYDSPAIVATYTNGTVINHNEISYCPYIGITLGWGWDSEEFSLNNQAFLDEVGNNQITYNFIHDVGKNNRDGGAIYTLGSSKGTVIAYNYLYNSWDGDDVYENGLYLDQGSAHIEVHHNVVGQNVGYWMHQWMNTIHDNVWYGNYYVEGTKSRDNGTNNTAYDNYAAADGTFSEYPAAQRIMTNAGLLSDAVKADVEEGFAVQHDIVQEFWPNSNSRYIEPAWGWSDVVINGQVGNTSYDSISKKVSISVKKDADITSLALMFKLDDGWTADKASGSVQDFTKPVVYTLTNGSTTIKWTVSVTKQIDPSEELPGEEVDFKDIIANHEEGRWTEEPYVINGVMYHNTYSGYIAEHFGGNTIFLFDMQIDLQSNSEFAAISLNNQDPTYGYNFAQDYGYGNTEYVISFNRDSIEVYKFDNGARTVFYGEQADHNSIYGTLPNNFFTPDEVHSIKCGAVDTNNGDVRVFLYIDGNLVFDFVDGDEPISGGYFAVYANSQTISLRGHSGKEATPDTTELDWALYVVDSLDVRDYKQETWGQLQTAIVTVNEILATNGGVTQEMVDRCTLILWDALNALEQVDGTAGPILPEGPIPPADPTDPTNPTNPTAPSKVYQTIKLKSSQLTVGHYTNTALTGEIVQYCANSNYKEEVSCLVDNDNKSSYFSKPYKFSALKDNGGTTIPVVLIDVANGGEGVAIAGFDMMLRTAFDCQILHFELQVTTEANSDNWISILDKRLTVDDWTSRKLRFEFPEVTAYKFRLLVYDIADVDISKDTYKDYQACLGDETRFALAEIDLLAEKVYNYNVTFKDWNGEIISSETYRSGSTIEIPADPIRAADDAYTYTFAGWDRNVASICYGDAIYTATYNAEYIDYTVTFEDWDGTVISSETYHYGDAVATPGNPTRAADDTYIYTFAGWDADVEGICFGNVVYTATYDATYIDYIVVFRNWDGSVLSSESYHYGDTVAAPSNPTRAADNTYTYTFNGWDKDVANVCCGDAVYTATYDATYIDYTVVFKDWDGTVISSETYHYGDTVVVPSNPTRAADNTYTYTFSGWDKRVENTCSGNVVYTATYSSTYISYTVVFRDWNGTILTTRTYCYGDTIAIPAAPTRVADNTYTYTFAGWDNDVASTCSGDAVYTATYDATYIDYMVVFKDWDGTVLSSETYHYGDVVTVPSTPRRAADDTYTYTFAGWSRTVTDCTGDVVYTAIYSSSYINYTVVFRDWNGIVLSTRTYHYGDAIVIPADPSRAADNTYTYAFAGWDKDVESTCSGDAVYTAGYTSAYIDYTVVFKDWDGTVLSSNTYHYGDTVTAPNNPTKAADNTYTYAFAGWDKRVENACSGDVVYTAVFTATFIDYTVVFKDWNDTVLRTRTYHYGDAVAAPSNPSRAADNTYTYSFTGWDKTVVNCAGDAVYTATYSSTYINYTVVFRDWNGTVLSTRTYHYGDAVAAPTNPTKVADNTYTYSFTGWDKDVVNCVGDVVYTAIYTANYIDYTVVFKNWDDAVLSSKTYHWGEIVELPQTPVREKDSYYTYTFSGWNMGVVVCSGNAEYQAMFDAEHYHTYTSKVTNPTCTGQGYTTNTCACGDTYKDSFVKENGHTYDNACDTSCNVCGANRVITHNYTATTTKATLTADGSIVSACTVCGNVASTTAIARPTTFTLSATSYNYDGKVKTPTVTVKDANGKTLVNGTDYTVTYASGRKALGSYNVTITMKGNYSGTKTLSFTIKLATPAVTVANAATGVKVSWGAISGAKTYTIYRSVYTNGAWSGWKAIKTGVTGTSYTDTTVKSNANVKYTVRAVNGNYASAYTSSSAIKYLATPKVTVANAATGVKVSWNKITGAKTYTIYRSVYSGGKWSGWTVVKTGATGTSYTDTTVKSGATVRYTVRAVNGKYASAYTASNTTKFLAQPKVTVAKATNGIKATWGKSAGATGYIVYRRAYVNGKWGAWEQVKVTTGLSFTDTTAKKGVTYQYTVRAYSGSYKSSYTNSSSIKR